MTSRRAAAAALLALGVLALSGCTADVTTRLDVTSATAAHVTATVTLRGQVAAAVTGNTKMRDQLVGLLRTRLHSEPTVTTGDGLLTVTADADYTALTANADVLGVGGATLTGTSDSATAKVTFTDPAALRTAITSGVTGTPDARAVAATMIAATTVTTVVHFPGGVTAATVTGQLPVHRTGGDVTVTRALATPATGTLTVTGDPTGPARWPYYLLGVAALAAAVTVARRLRS